MFNVIRTLNDLFLSDDVKYIYKHVYNFNILNETK